jgi:hypothetical protein
MKHLRVAAIGLSLLAGVPWVLLSVGGGPLDAVDRLRRGTLASDLERLAALIELGTWLAWSWICLAIVLQVWASRRSEPILIGRHRLVLLFVASLWSVLAALRSGPAPSAIVSEPSTTVVDIETRRSIPLPVAPLASVQCALIAEYILRRVADRRLDAIKNMGKDHEVAPLSRTSDLLWRSLSMRKETSLQSGGIPVGVDFAGGIVSSAGLVDVHGASVEEAEQIRNHLAMSVEAFGEDWRPGEPTTLVRDTHGWHLSTGENLRPFALFTEDRHSLTRLMNESGVTREVSSPTRMVHGDWLVCVRLLGPVEARWNDDTEVRFRKSKSLELLAWLVTHPDRPTRMSARTAMWMVDVQSSYFNNVVSDLRGVLASANSRGRCDLLDKTSQDRLILDDRVISDADILRSALACYRDRITDQSRNDLRAALSLVRNLPFSGSDYLWPDPEGITSNLVHLVMSAATEFAEEALDRQDVDDVYFATDKGLKVFPGDEDLLRLRAAVARRTRVQARGETSG